MVRLTLFLTASSLFAADSALLFNRPFGGSINDSAVAIAVDSDGHVIVSGNTASYDFPVTNGTRNTATQFAESTDGARTWQALGNLPAGVPVALAIDPVTPSNWYAAGSVAIYKSTDAGATWRAVHKQTGCELYPFVCYNAAILINPAQPSTIYVPISSAIYKTTDSGENWTTLPTLPGNVTTPTYLALDPANPDHLFAVAYNYNFRSFDGGQTWIQFFPPAKNPGNACGAGVAFDPLRANVAYFVDHCELFRSSDSGLTWTSLSTPFPLASQVFAVAKSGLLYVTAYDGIYSSDDGGATWMVVLPVTGASQGQVRIMAIDPASGGIYTGNSLNLGRNVISVVFDPARPGHAIALTPGASTAFIARLDYSGTVLDATYFGGQGTTNIVAMTLDAAGNIYIAGNSTSPDFPVTTATPRGRANWFTASLDASLSPRYATWVPNIDMIGSIAVDSGGRAVIGGTAPPNPTAQWQCVAIKLTTDGSDTVFRAAIDGSVNNCVAASDAADDTILAGSSFQGAAVSKIDPGGNLLFTTSLGAAGRSVAASAIAVDSSANIYVSGNTSVVDTSTSSPGTCPYPSSAVATGLIGTITSYQTDDAFVTKLDPGGNVLATKLIGGNCYDVARGISLGPDGSVWITGITQSSPFPQAMPFESGPAFSLYKAFVTNLDPSLTSLRLSSYITAGNQPSVAADAFGNAYVAGATTTPQSPYSGPPAPPKYLTGVQASLAKMQIPLAAPIAISGAGNAFTLRDGPVSAGQITLVTVTGLAPDTPVDLTLTPTTTPLPRTLAGTQVLFDGEAATLVSVAAGSVMVVAPYSLAGKQQTSIQVVFNGVVSAPLLADVLPDPSFLSRDGSGSGQAFAINPDGTANSRTNPAPQNAQVTLFETGLGTAPATCPEGGVDATTGYLCGIIQTQTHTPGYSFSTIPVPNSPVTIAVK